MGFPTKVQLIKRKASEQWYINFPSAVAQAMEFARGETVEWLIEDKSLLALRRPPSAPVLKKTSTLLLAASSNSGASAAPLLPTASRRAGASPRAEFLALPGPQDHHRSAAHLRPAISGLVGGLPDVFETPHLDRDLFAACAAVSLAFGRAGSVVPRPGRFAVPQTGAKTHGVAGAGIPSAPIPDQLHPRPALPSIVRRRACRPRQAIRMVPVGFLHCPTPPNPANGHAGATSAYRQAGRQANPGSRLGRLTIRVSLPAHPDGRRLLRLLVDGGYTNATFLKELPARTTLTGRIRKDAKLYYPPVLRTANPDAAPLWRLRAYARSIAHGPIRSLGAV